MDKIFTDPDKKASNQDTVCLIVHSLKKKEKEWIVIKSLKIIK